MGDSSLAVPFNNIYKYTFLSENIVVVIVPFWSIFYSFSFKRTPIKFEELSLLSWLITVVMNEYVNFKV